MGRKNEGSYQPLDRSVFTQPVAFEKVYPTVDSLLIVCEEHEGGRTRRSTFDKGSFTGYVRCSRGEGGTEIKDILDEMVAKRQAHRKTSVSCSGREKTGSGTRRCEQEIDVEITINYKKRPCTKCGQNEVDDVYKIEFSHEGVDIHHVIVPTCQACGEVHVTPEMAMKVEEAREKKKQ